MQCDQCGADVSAYKNPVPTVDIIIAFEQDVVLIERKNQPHGWALPGGFVDYGESYEAAAVREAKEETGLDITLIRQFHTYSHPDRDQRQHTASTVFIATAVGTPRGSDDALQAQIFNRDKLPELVFDHALILEDYFNNIY